VGIGASTFVIKKIPLQAGTSSIGRALEIPLGAYPVQVSYLSLTSLETRNITAISVIFAHLCTILVIISIRD
jgi:hypothetical protein